MCAHKFQLVSELYDFPCSFDFVKLTKFSSSFRLLRIGSFRGNFSVVLDLPSPRLGILLSRSLRIGTFPWNAHFAAPNYDSCFASVLSEESSPWFWTYPPPLALGSSRHALYGLGLSRGQYNLGAELNYVLFLSQVFSICFFFVFIPL